MAMADDVDHTDRVRCKWGHVGEDKEEEQAHEETESQW